MHIHDMHPEDVKAAIRKRHGSVKHFAKFEGISVWAVHDFLRGRTNKKAQKAVESLLIEAADTTLRQSTHPKKLVNVESAAA